MKTHPYHPPPLDAIPTLFTAESILRYVGRDHPFHWIRPERMNPDQDTHEWAYYREPLPHLDDPERFAGITLEITRTIQPGLLLAADAYEPSGYMRRMGFRRAYPLQQQSHSPKDAYTELLSQIQHLSQRWLFEARLFIARMLQVKDPQERHVFERICTKEEFKDEPAAFTPPHIANWCGWSLPSTDPQRHRGLPDSARVVPYVHRLAHKQLLIERDGEFHTPEFIVDGMSSLIYASVCPSPTWLQRFAVPGVLGSIRPAGSGGQSWLSALLEDPSHERGRA